MKVFFISPIGATSPGLFETFVDTFVAEGHTIVTDINEASVAFFDSHSGYLPYDWNVCNIALEKRLPIAYFDAFDYHCDSSINWFGFNDFERLLPLIYENDWAHFLYRVATTKIQFVYFMRKMQTNADYGENVCPLELCQYPDHDFSLTTKGELNSRPFDACFIGAESPRRKEFIEALQADGRLKLDIQFTTERIPHDEWLNRHRQAKFFIEADGGGLGSERPYQLMTIAPMLKQHNLQLIVNDFDNLNECIKIGYSGFTVDHFCHVLKYPDLVYNMYLNGVSKLKTYFNPEYRAKYILSILKQNNIQ